jgi:hypothetical protein
MLPYTGGQIHYKMVKKIYAYGAGRWETVQMDGLPINPRAIYMEFLWDGQMTKLPIDLEMRYTPLRGNMVNSSSLHDHAFAAVRVLPTQGLQSRHVSAGIEASRRARILSPPTEPPVLVLWLNQVTRRFCGEPQQTPRLDSGHEPLPCTGSSRRLRLAFLAMMWPALDPVGHRVPRVEPTCLSTPWRPRKAKTFNTCASPAPTQIKPQPAPAILDQKSVLTMLSITHHNQERRK